MADESTGTGRDPDADAALTPAQATGSEEAPRLAEGIPVRTRRRRKKRTRWQRTKRWISEHKALTVLIGLMLALLLALLLWLWWLWSQLDDVTRFPLDVENRPTRVPGDQVNILVLGVDDLDYQRDVGPDVYEMLESGQWQKGAFRSDTMMLVHLEAGRRQAQVVSFPRDSYVDIPGNGRSKINAAFSWGGPELAVETVEQNFDVFIDHVVVVNFGGFVDVTDTVGGVDIHFPQEAKADNTGRMWSPGTHRLNGDDALFYARQRYDLPRGDFDRIHRQQNFLRALMDRVVDRGTLLNPVKLSKLADQLSGLVAVDESLDNGTLRGLALDARHLRNNAIRFVTLPNSGSATIDGASIVQVRMAKAKEMLEAIEYDQFESWYAHNEIDELPEPDAVD